MPYRSMYRAATGLFTFLALLLPTMNTSHAQENKMLAIGQEAPDFTLSSHTGNTVSLRDYKGKNYVVLIFYPGDQTPICTKQLCEIRDDYSRFKERNTVVFGVNPADSASHTTFASRHGFQFPLLVDPGKTVIKAYGCKGLFMTQRTVYVVGPDGRILYAQRGKPAVDDILKSIPAASPAADDKKEAAE